MKISQNNNTPNPDDAQNTPTPDDFSTTEERFSATEEGIGAEENKISQEKIQTGAENFEENADERTDHAAEENANQNSKTTMFLRRVLGGDILAADWMRRQMGVIVLCVVCAIIYITNRYSAQHEIIEIENLQKELEEVRFYGLTRAGEVTGRTRQSMIEKALQETPDSLLQLPDKPPFLIH